MSAISVCLITLVRVTYADCARLVDLPNMSHRSFGWTTISHSHFWFAVAVFCHVSVVNGIYHSVACLRPPPSSCIPQLTLLTLTPAGVRDPSAAVEIQLTHVLSSMFCLQMGASLAG